MTDNWDGITKYRYTDDENGEAIFDASDEIHDDLKELVETWRQRRQTQDLNEAHIEIADFANDLEEIIHSE